MTSAMPAHGIRDDFGRRLELVPMDRFCGGITVALYRTADGSAVTVHSYSGLPGAPARLAWLAGAMATIAGMVPGGTDGRTVRFACGSWHEPASRRVFLEACRADPTVALRSSPLETNDGRTGQYITIEPLGLGAYRVAAIAADPTAASRAPAVAAGLAKLSDVAVDQVDASRVTFACGAPHDALVGFLLPRAINVRAALREQEEAAGRGVLVAPSAQEAPS